MKKTVKRMTALIMALVLLFSILPFSAFAEEQEGASASYSLSDHFELGKTYLIADSAEGDALVLCNNKSTFSTLSVTISEGTITAEGLESAEWESRETQSGSALVGLYNDSTVLKIDASSTPYINTSASGYNAGGFGYTAASHISYPYGNPAQDYYLGSDALAGFAASESEEGLGGVYLFVKSEADPGGQEEPEEEPEEEPRLHPSGTVYLGFTSDPHNSGSNTSYNRLDTWIKALAQQLGTGFADFAICGDLGDGGSFTSEKNFWSYAGKVIDLIRESDRISGNGIYIPGNHEWSNGRFGTTGNAYRSYYSTAGTVKETDNYIIYAFGVNSSTNNNIISSDTAALGEYLSTAPKNVPIFVLSHFPLHDFGSRKVTGKDEVISVLNQYGSDHSIIFLWGHNHSETDTHYDTIYGPEKSLDGTALNFIYAAAGCMSDSEYSSGSKSVKGKGLVVQITDGQVASMTYYGILSYHEHSYGAWVSISETEHQRVCTGDSSHVETARHSFDENGLCTDCGYELPKEYIYVSASSFVLGETYLIVNVSDGEGKALSNNQNTFGTVSVSVSNGCASGDDLSTAEWTAKATKTGSTLIGLYNGSKVLKINGSTTPASISTSATGYNAGGFSYTAAKHISYPYGSPAKDYFIGSDDSSVFAASDNENELGQVYIFLRQEKTDCDEHDWGEPEYVWSADHKSCTASRYCRNSPLHKESSEATVMVEVIAPSCETEGSSTYTASFEEDWAEPQSYNTTTPPIGHSWGSVEYEWSADFSTCTASRGCIYNLTHIDCASATVSSRVSVEADCETEGERSVSASFQESWAQTQSVTVPIALSDHSWGSVSYLWDEELSSCTASRSCLTNPEHQESATALVLRDTTVPADCENEGLSTIRAIFPENWAENQTVTEPIPATLHEWSGVSYVWAEDLSSCTASRSCLNNSEHNESASAVVTHSVITSPSRSSNGLAAYTASFQESWAETKTVTKVLRFSGLVLELSADKAQPGEECTVLLSLSQNPGIASLSGELIYDNSLLTPLSAEALYADGEWRSLSAFPGSAVLSWTNDSDLCEDTPLLRLTFLVSAEADGDTMLGFRLESARNAEGMELYPEIGTLQLNLSAHTPGDINGDGLVNGFDVILLNRYVKNKGVGITVVENSTDVTGDGVTNGLDVILLNRYVKAKGIGLVLH